MPCITEVLNVEDTGVTTGSITTGNSVALSSIQAASGTSARPAGVVAARATPGAASFGRTTVERPGSPVGLAGLESHINAGDTRAIIRPSEARRFTAPSASICCDATFAPTSGSGIRPTSLTAARDFTTRNCSKPSGVASITRSTPGSASA